MKVRFPYNPIIMIVCSVLFFTSMLLGSSCCKNPSDSESETVTDIDGNEYRTVRIGNQVWMAENLKVTHYRNGDAIPNVTGDTEWSNLSTGAFCHYGNHTGNTEVYGCLYNWYAVNDSRDIAPEGWHVPTDADWQTLVDFLGGDVVAGGKMKESGFDHWQSPNASATNESGLTVLPAGYRLSMGGFNKLGYNAIFWSSTEFDPVYAMYRRIYHDDGTIYRTDYDKHYGFSIRCVKD